MFFTGLQGIFSDHEAIWERCYEHCVELGAAYRDDDIWSTVDVYFQLYFSLQFQCLIFSSAVIAETRKRAANAFIWFSLTNRQIASAIYGAKSLKPVRPAVFKLIIL